MLMFGMVNLKCKQVYIMEDKDLIKIYNTLSNEDLMHLFDMAKERLFVWNPNDKTCYHLNLEIPCSPNGNKIQINIEEDNFKFKPMVSKE